MRGLLFCIIAEDKESDKQWRPWQYPAPHGIPSGLDRDAFGFVLFDRYGVSCIDRSQAIYLLPPDKG